MTFTPPPRTPPPHWSHGLPVPPPLIPFLYPITLSLVSLSPSLQGLLPSLLHPPLHFCSVPAPVSSLFPSAPTIFGGPVSPPRRSVPSQRARIGRVATNCATVFFLRRTDVLTLTIPASFIAPARGEAKPLPVPPSARHSPRQPPSDPALEGVQAASIFPVST